MNHIILKQSLLSQFTYLPLVSSHHNARFALFLFVALIVHVFIVFQINFKMPEKVIRKPLPLDIIINPIEKNQVVKKADYYAQSNQRGGGQKEMKTKPSNVIASKAKTMTPATEVKALVQKQVIVEKVKKTKVTAEKKISKSQLSVKTKAKQKVAKLQKKIVPKKTKISSQYLADLKQQIIDLEADIDIKTKVYSKRSKHKYLNASTAKALDAQYIRQWTRKIERIGNLNYPPQARKNRLSGKLILAVTLDPQGKILNITVRKSSRHKTLDDAAIRIVKLSAPFAPIPKAVLQQNSALVITRTWLFSQKTNGQFSMN